MPRKKERLFSHCEMQTAGPRPPGVRAVAQVAAASSFLANLASAFLLPLTSFPLPTLWRAASRRMEARMSSMVARSILSQKLKKYVVTGSKKRDYADILYIHQGRGCVCVYVEPRNSEGGRRSRGVSIAVWFEQNPSNREGRKVDTKLCRGVQGSAPCFFFLLVSGSKTCPDTSPKSL